MENPILTILLVIFVYLGGFPFGLATFVFSGRHNGIEDERQYQLRALGSVLVLCLIFGVLVGIIAAVVAANPVQGAGFSFTGNGILGFPQLILLSVIAGIIATVAHRAWFALVILPISLVGSFALTWWGASFVFPPVA
jgi:hypothetical protein